MTLSTTTVVARYSGDGSTRTFSFPYAITAAADVNVRLVSAAGDVTTPTGVTVTPTPKTPNVPPWSGASIVFNVGDVDAPAAGSTVVIWRGPALTQGYSFAGEVDPLSALNIFADRLYAVLQDERAFGVRVPPTTVAAFDPTLPSPTQGAAGDVLALNSDKSGFEWGSDAYVGPPGPKGDPGDVSLSTLASTSNGEGASLIGIQDAGGKITATTVEGALAEHATLLAALDQAVILKGTWDASGGSFPGSGSAQAGWSYIVSTGGTVNAVDFAVGDRVIAITDNASTSTYANNWFKADGSDQVTSVAGRTGTVTLTSSDLTNLTISTSSPSGGSNGDLWFQRAS